MSILYKTGTDMFIVLRRRTCPGLEIMRLMAPGWTAHRMNGVGQNSSMNIIISAFFSTNYLAGAMPDPSMLNRAFDFIEKDQRS